MFLTFVRNRITELRMEKKISEYKLSLELGHSKNYIQNITSGKSQPSLSELGFIIEYFQITPGEFFGGDTTDSLNVIELHKLSKQMSDEQVRLLIYLAEAIRQNGDLPEDLQKRLSQPKKG